MVKPFYLQNKGLLKPQETIDNVSGSGISQNAVQNKKLFWTRVVEYLLFHCLFVFFKRFDSPVTVRPVNTPRSSCFVVDFLDFIIKQEGLFPRVSFARMPISIPSINKAVLSTVVRDEIAFSFIDSDSKNMKSALQFFHNFRIIQSRYTYYLFPVPIVNVLSSFPIHFDFLSWESSRDACRLSILYIHPMR